MKEKDITYNGLDSIEKMVEHLAKHRNEILENFSKAYLAETGLLPSEVELICQEMPMKDNIVEHIYYFRKKDAKIQS